jgi:hypothetical protein
MDVVPLRKSNDRLIAASAIWFTTIDKDIVLSVWVQEA